MSLDFIYIPVIFGEDYIWKMTLRDTDSFPVIKYLPNFYQEVIIAFNNVKYIKPFEWLSSSEIA